MKFWWVNAFANRAFAGNPAGVVFMEDKKLSDMTMQQLTNEFQCSQTAFVQCKNARYSIRWFSPKNGGETPICGHATLASACALFEDGIVQDSITFSSLAGPLTVHQEGFCLRMILPQKILRASQSTFFNGKVLYEDDLIHVLELKSVGDVESFNPDLDMIKKLPGRALCITARAQNMTVRGYQDIDFVSRYFAPKVGIDEDPVCGSSYARLAPFWAKKLNKTNLKAFALSPRGGVLDLQVLEDQVHYLTNATVLMCGNLKELME